MKQIVKLDSIDAYHRMYGLVTRHPLVSVIDLKQARIPVNHLTMEYGLYAIYLKNNANCSIRYGRKQYDYQAGTIVSFSPGQVIDVDMEVTEFRPDVVGLLFHPDLIFGTPLAEKIASFRFFDYSESESLHLSDAERAQFLECLARIDAELNSPVDDHSAPILSMHIQVLLEYLHRFYDRQFTTRHKVNSEVLTNFERHLKAYYEGDLHEKGLPGVAYFADKAHLSTGYFSDLIRKETGSSPKDLIALHLVQTAKQRLVATRDNVNSIAYGLGFEYPAHFTRMFKRITGLTPREYRETASAG